MNDTEFVNGALRTENPYDEPLFGRVTHPAAMVLFRQQLENAMAIGRALDQFKKHFFYGKPLRHALRVTPEDFDQQVKDRMLDNIRLLHAVIGFITESAEIVEALYKHIFENDELDTINLIEEGGDLFWYMAILADALSVTFNDMKDRNNRKLRARYPGRFTQTNALVRDLETERRVLEFTPGELVQMVEPAPEHIADAEPVAFRGSFGGTAKIGDPIESTAVDDSANWLQKIKDTLQRLRGERGNREDHFETLLRVIRERDNYWNPNKEEPQFRGQDVLPVTVQSLLGILERQAIAQDRNVLETAERIIARRDSLEDGGTPRYPQFCHQDLMPEGVQSIINILQSHCGERGDNEGAVETLERLIRERNTAEATVRMQQDVINSATRK